MTKIITGDPTTDRIIEQQTKMLNHFFQTTEVDDMPLKKIEEILRPVPTTQMDIIILSDGKYITETTLDVFAEYSTGDESVGEPEGWLINSIMLGKCDVTNEMDLVEIQQYLKEIL